MFLRFRVKARNPSTHVFYSSNNNSVLYFSFNICLDSDFEESEEELEEATPEKRGKDDKDPPPAKKKLKQ